MNAQHDANETWCGHNLADGYLDELTAFEAAPEEVRVEWKHDELRLSGVVRPGSPSKLNTFGDPSQVRRMVPDPTTRPDYDLRVKVAALDALRGGGRSLLARTVPVLE